MFGGYCDGCLVAKEFNNEVDQATYAATPPLEAMELLAEECETAAGGREPFSHDSWT